MGASRWVKAVVGGALLGIVLVTSLAATSRPAAATWSLVAVDQATNEVGVAIASCVPADVLGDPERPLVPVVLRPGLGAAVTQGQLNLEAPDRLVVLTDAGVAPAGIIDDLTTADFDELAHLRQHAVASLSGEVAAFTGDQNGETALDAQGAGVSVQGNLLVSESVVADALDAYLSGRRAGLPLAQGLVDGLVAGAEAGGDRRCDDQGALFAQVAVAGPNDDPAEPAILLTVVVDPGDGQDPVVLLADAFAEGRRGLVDAGEGTDGAGQVVLALALAVGVAMLAGGAYALRRGIGSISARR